MENNRRRVNPFAGVGPISAKYLPKFPAIEFISVISVIFLEMIAGNFFSFAIAFLITDHVFFSHIFFVPKN